MERRGFVAIAQRLPSLKVPVRIIYGAPDRLLPDVAETMARVKVNVPLPDLGHFIQLEAPAQVGDLLARFF